MDGVLTGVQESQLLKHCVTVSTARRCFPLSLIVNQAYSSSGLEVPLLPTLLYRGRL